MTQQAPLLWVPVVFFPVLWLGISTLLAVLTGWYSLMRRFPDRPEERALLKLSQQSGSMGLGVAMRRILGLSTCSSGLRVSMNRLFGPFNRAFFVPWEQIKVTRKDSPWWPRVELQFGDSSFGRLAIADHVANKLWRSMPERWPEAGPLPGLEMRAHGIAIVVRQSLLRTVFASIFASIFFLLLPRLLAPGSPHLPVGVAILFPAVFFGLFSLIEYWRRR